MAPQTRFLGCVLNPKTLLPCPVYKEKRRTIEIYDPALEDKEGTGYYDEGDHGVQYAASEATGFPRVHTPSGVKTRAAGYGTVLYTGLCLGAKLVDSNNLDMSLNTTGPGISSNEHRSNAAEAWWRAAKDTFDLAYSETVTAETEEALDETYNRNTRLGRNVLDAVENAISEYQGGSISLYDIRVSGETKGENETDADVYPYDSSSGCLGARTMVPFWFVSDAYDGQDHLWNEFDDPDAGEIQVFDDVFGCMLLTGDVDPDFVRFIQKVAVAEGKKKLFDEVMLVSFLGKKIEEAGETAWGSESLYEGLRPFRLNPKDPAVQQAFSSFTKNERIAVERRAERVKALGLDKLADFDL